ncbi:EFR1 family ferrodoxin [Clostridioides sp. ES-W-0016-02]|uniref:EFR1 family ferrodoxin n=1 Tax=Clostridioides sp. ES-W-0016-02 TaxID=2770788 RepID=UPI001D12F09C|nr:4Fe-4S binding protein [Clostridioides sp. ES-W-0016-02]
MKDKVIYYFTSTGNSLSVAESISNKINANIIRICETTDVDCNSDMIGFVFPLYFWGLPNLVSKFISNLNIKSDKPYIFAVVTCGGMIGGSALHDVDALLKEKGHGLNLGSRIQMVSNYICEFKIKDDKKIDNLLRKAEIKVNEVSEDIVNKKSNKIGKTNFIYKKFYKKYISSCTNQDSHFSVEDTCIECGICSKVCPVNNIDVEKGRPKFLHNCEHCLACVHWCPKQAIQWKDATKNKKRYHNPNIKLEDMISEKSKDI